MRTELAVVVLAVTAAVAGCRQDMHDQPKDRPLRPSAFFPDGRSARPPVADTVSSAPLPDDPSRVTGKKDKRYLTAVPLPLTAALLQRGRERFDIYCSPCHDRVGTGNGMIVQRGFKQPPSFHDDRVRGLPDGYLFEVASQGFGAMPGYASQVPVDDRWAIVAYVRALELSQSAPVDELSLEDRRRLDGGAP